LGAQSRSIASLERLTEQWARPHNAQGRSPSYFSTLGKFQCILYVNAEITNCVLDLGVAKQDLDRSKVASGLVDHGSLRSPKRMRAIILPPQPNRSDPLIDQSGVLPSAEMIGVADSTRKGIVIDRSSPSLKPGKQTCPDWRPTGGSGHSVRQAAEGNLVLEAASLLLQVRNLNPDIKVTAAAAISPSWFRLVRLFFSRGACGREWHSLTKGASETAIDASEKLRMSPLDLVDLCQRAGKMPAYRLLGA
jgi:hypothetical protein